MTYVLKYVSNMRNTCEISIFNVSNSKVIKCKFFAAFVHSDWII